MGSNVNSTGKSKLARTTVDSPVRTQEEGKQVKKNRADKNHYTSWDDRFEELRQFYRKFQHSDVPSSYPENPGLCNWVQRQRWEYAVYSSGDRSHHALTPERIVKLMTVNFTWNMHEKAWENMYAALLNFKAQYGHTNVPPAKYCHTNIDRQLAKWVRLQRFQIRRLYSCSSTSGKQQQRQRKSRGGNITPERAQRLYDIGFSCSNSGAINEVYLRINSKSSHFPL